MAASQYVPDPTDRLDMLLARTLAPLQQEQLSQLTLKKLGGGKYVANGRHISITITSQGELLVKEDKKEDWKPSESFSAGMPLLTYLYLTLDAAINSSPGPKDLIEEHEPGYIPGASGRLGPSPGPQQDPTRTGRLSRGRSSRRCEGLRSPGGEGSPGPLSPTRRSILI